jgi:hypothetical protein
VTPYLHEDALCVRGPGETWVEAAERHARDVLELGRMTELADLRTELSLPSGPDMNVRITESD